MFTSFHHKQTPTAETKVVWLFSCDLFGSVGYFADSRFICAVGATVKDPIALYSMADYLTAAVRAFGR
jgi:hypothetical protein